jgi:hypothetical protein
VTWQEKNVAVGLAALFVLIVMAHLTFGSGSSGAASPKAPATEPVPEAVVEGPAAEPLETSAPGTEGR